ncbi:MAG: UDP-N-acetylmuramate--alanine ligase [Candidatus Midichloriaceae bacterium]|jgi:UDP-N-acetylmuramate--alanine ligase
MKLTHHLFDKGIKIHIIGIGGIGMSGLAKVLHANNVYVQGSDKSCNNQVVELKKLGVKVFTGHAEENVNGISIVVKSSAIKNDNIEILSATKLKKPVISRAELLSNMMYGGYNISITGAHGKTSTTSMMFSLLRDNPKEPSVLCGGIINEIDSNAFNGRDNVNIIEADESDGTFLSIPSNIGIITNIDKEHLDYYGSMESIIAMNKLFVDKVLLNDMLISCGDCDYLSEINLLYKNNPKFITYGIESKDFDVVAKNISSSKKGLLFDIEFSQKFQKITKTDSDCMKDVQTNMFGRHNILNFLAAISVSKFMKCNEERTRLAIMGYKGVQRRFSFLGEKNGITFIDDYAHHPKEIEATLLVAKDYAKQRGGNVVVIFEPHKYSRFTELYQDFFNSLLAADSIIVLDVFAAGEKNNSGVDIIKFAKEFDDKYNATYCSDTRDIGVFIDDNVKADDYLVFMGAGDISKIAKNVFQSFGILGENS